MGTQTVDTDIHNYPSPSLAWMCAFTHAGTGGCMHIHLSGDDCQLKIKKNNETLRRKLPLTFHIDVFSNLSSPHLLQQK